MINLILGDCLDKLKDIEDKSIDMILCDLPYGTTPCKWDSVIPFDRMWNEINRIIKDKKAICLFGIEPFSSKLRLSNIHKFKYDWYLNKNWVTGFLNAKKQPLRKIEICSIFNSEIYYPQNLIEINKIKNRGVGARTNNYCGSINIQKHTNFPKNLIESKRDSITYHPTQKPVSLLEYLIKTYTLENELVLDFCMGSGSTGIACIQTNRNFIGIEKEEEYFNIAKKRIRSYDKR